MQRERAPAVPDDGAAVALFVQICCKGPDRAGAPGANRWYSALLLAADPGSERLCNRFGQVPAPSRPKSPTRTTASEPLGAVAPVTPRDSRSAIPGPAGGRAGSFTALLHPLLRSFFSYSEGLRGVVKVKERSGGKGGEARLLLCRFHRGALKPMRRIACRFSAGLARLFRRFRRREGRLSGRVPGAHLVPGVQVAGRRGQAAEPDRPNPQPPEHPPDRHHNNTKLQRPAEQQ